MSLFQSLTSSFKSKPISRGFLSLFPGVSQELRTFIATFDIPYVQRISVGVQAVTPEQAKQSLQRAFSNGSITKDTQTMPLLESVFEPCHDTGQMPSLQLSEVEEFPDQDVSVFQMKCLNSSAAMLAMCRHFDELLIEADVGQGDQYRTIEVSASTAERLRSLMRSLADS